MPSNIPSTWIRKYLTASRRVREAQAQPNEEDVRYPSWPRLGDKVHQDPKEALRQQLKPHPKVEGKTMNMNIMESYWNDRHNEALRPEVEEVCIGVELIKNQATDKSTPSLLAQYTEVMMQGKS